MLFTYCVSVVSYWAGRVCCSHIVFLFLATGQAGYVVHILCFCS